MHFSGSLDVAHTVDVNRIGVSVESKRSSLDAEEKFRCGLD
jgi:hypothetical protein